MCIRDRYDIHFSYSISFNDSYIQDTFRMHRPVSYTHLDVYKRQPIFQNLPRLNPLINATPFPKPSVSRNVSAISLISNSNLSVSYTHLDVYKRQVPYYSVIGGWVIKYLYEYIIGNGGQLASDGYFTGFISSGGSAEICFLIFTAPVSYTHLNI